MRQILYIQPDSVRVANEAELPQLLGESGGYLWLDLFNEPEEVTERFLRETFNFNPLAIEDALQEAHVPKVNDWEEYLSLVVRTVAYENLPSGSFDFEELDVFVGPNFLLTYHDKRIAGVANIWEAVQQDDRFRRNNVFYLLYRLSDAIVDDYLLLIDALQTVLDGIDDQIFKHAERGLLEEIFDTKRILLNLRRVLEPQQGVYTRLARTELSFIDKREKVLFRDVEDHYVRLVGHVQSMRDLIASAIDTYLSIVNNRMNDVMKVLTIFTALFMPLTFITGFFGMNFFQTAFDTSPWTGEAALTLTLAAMVALPIGMFIWMRYRKWM